MVDGSSSRACPCTTPGRYARLPAGPAAEWRSRRLEALRTHRDEGRGRRQTPIFAGAPCLRGMRRHPVCRGLDPGRDLGDETFDLAPLIRSAAAAIAHDDG